MKSLLGLVTAAWMAAAAVISAAPDDPIARVDAFVAAEMRRARIPGMALAVVKDSRVLMARGYGFANVEHQVPVTRATVFQSGSIAKQFAATAVMLLAEEGKLSIDDPLGKFFAPAPESWNRIRVRHLLSHTSGMQDYPDDFDLRRDYTEDELLGIVKSAPLAFAPGEGWSYSNLGYVTLGILIRKASGRFYGDDLAERIFRPLGMTAARVISESDIVPGRADGYRVVGAELKNQEWVSPSVNTTADGSLYLTLDDMLKWEAGLSEGRPLSRTGLERMWSPVRLDGGRMAPYGFGWFTVEAAGRRVLFHGGAWQGFKGFIARFRPDRLTVILFANQQETNEFRIARGVASVFIPELALGSEPVPETEPEVRTLARRVLGQIFRGAPEAGLFTPAAWAELSPERIRALVAQLGALTLPQALVASMELLGRSEERGIRVYRYALTDLTASAVFTMRLAPDGRIAGVDLE
jgi:CubicO group peptidase (beta-lactamase class C family)